jgi:hypothetical protein
MGKQSRYPSRRNREIDQRIEQVITRPKPISLTDEELEKDRTLVTAAKEPVPVRAWVRYPETVIRATGVALAWTDRAVLVEWETAGGGVASAWVWASAVQRATPPAGE